MSGSDFTFSILDIRSQGAQVSSTSLAIGELQEKYRPVLDRHVNNLPFSEAQPLLTDLSGRLMAEIYDHEGGGASDESPLEFEITLTDDPLTVIAARGWHDADGECDSCEEIVRLALAALGDDPRWMHGAVVVKMSWRKRSDLGARNN